MMRIMKRGAEGFGVWLLMVLFWVVNGIALSLGYWLSDVVYGIGLWPIGAIMRIFLLFYFLGWLFWALMLVFALFGFMAAAFRRDPSY